MDKPIIFSAPMVRALLDGRKTQTRRLIPTKGPANLFDGSWTDEYVMLSGNAGWRQRFVRYAPGDRLWVREAHALVPASAYRMSEGVARAVDPEDRDRAAIYREGFDRSTGGIRWRPSMFMPRWASRLTLHVSNVRAQRLQEISEADAKAEGAKAIGAELAPPDAEDIRSYVWGFHDLWNSVHGPDAWDANPWVAAITFWVERVNIDNASALQEQEK